MSARHIGWQVPKKPITKAEAKALIKGVKDAFRRLSEADPNVKAELCAELGLRLEYDPKRQVVSVELPLYNRALRGWDSNPQPTD